MEGGSSLIMSVPNIITSSPSGGRFDFDDGGTYCGGWQDGKAHGHGVCTGPKNVGEYSGSWNFGFEMSGVYKWTNGAVYEGRWQNGKRHGVGVEYNGKWIYKGEWSQGLKGRYGVKASSNSAVKYEGTWANGLQDGYGSETYSDGGYYQGQMCRGLRHGYGVRKSAPYGDSQLNNPGKNGPLVGGPAATSSMLTQANSLQSSGSALDLSQLAASHLSGGASNRNNNNNNNNDDDDSPKPEDGFKPNIDRTLVSKNGFVLVAKPLDVPMPSSSSKLDGGSSALSMSTNSSANHLSMGGKQTSRRNSFTNKLAQTAHRLPGQTTSGFLRGLRLKKQRSTSDMDTIGAGSKSSRNQLGSNILNNYNLNQNNLQNTSDFDQPIVPFTLSPEELDITDPSTVETYTGDWKHDKRNGHGVCDRSDGLKYEGQWHNDMKCGYGVTTFKDGTKEEGKYKNNILIVDSKVKRFFQLGGSNIRQRIDDAVKMAQQAHSMALKKAEIADTRAATARDKADQAMTAAYEADRDSQIAYSVARQYSDSQQQQQMAMQHQLQLQQQQGYDTTQLGPLNMASSPLQLRRISQNQQRNNGPFGAGPFNSQQSTFEQHLQDQQTNLDQQDQRAADKQFLGPIEPFNGRRGSFRGGSQPGAGGGSTSGANYSSSRAQGGSSSSYGQQHQHSQLANAHAHNPAAAQRQTSDPFSDLFDHYKSSSVISSASVSGAFGVRGRRGLSKQTSLDQAHLRANALRQATGSSGSQHGGDQNAANEQHSSRMSSRFSRMSSSMDQADDEHALAASRLGAPMHAGDQRHNQQSSMQQQFRHLVTSGEHLQQQQQQPADYPEQQHQTTTTDENASNNALGPTPTNSSYLGGGHSSASHQTPSPNESIGGPPTLSSYTTRPTSGGGGQQQAVSGLAYSRQPTYNQPSSYGAVGGPQQQQQHQADYYSGGGRDVHSLADEQLYLADRRRLHDELLGRTEYSNYDFTISNAPRPSQRLMRRTASLSRNTPVLLRSRSQVQPETDALEQSAATGWRRSQSPAPNSIANHLQQQQHHHQQQTIPAFVMSRDSIAAGDQMTQVAQTGEQLAHCNNSANLGLADGSLFGSTGALNRKPSLQVRYDLGQLGGLMSREEVAALSHAQREQKRLQAELAERRAKRPLLHLYLSLKEFLSSHQLVFSVLFVNFCLLKLFLDLIM